MKARALSEQSFLVLTVLAESPKHGYAIVQAVQTLSEDRVSLPVATLYGVLDRLIGDGLAALDREEIVKGRLRRYYRITDDGLAVLTAEVARMAANLRAARGALRSRGLRPATGFLPATGTRPATGFRPATGIRPATGFRIATGLGTAISGGAA